MDFVTWGVFFFCFLLCGISVFFISVYGTSEQSFEDGLIKTGDKKKERKSSGKKEEAPTDASAGTAIRKKPGKFSKKTHDEKEPKVMEPLVEKKLKSTQSLVKTVRKKRIKDVEESNILSVSLDLRKAVKEPESAQPEVIALVDSHKIVKKDKPTAPVELEPVIAAPVKIAKPEEVPIKKVAKEEKRPNNAGAKSKILIEEVETEVKAPVLTAAAPAVETKKQVKAEPAKQEKAKLVEPAKQEVKEPEVIKIENAVQKSEEVKTVEAPVVSKPANKKKSEGQVKANGPQMSAKLMDPAALISAVKIVSLEESQLQQLIDILLNKQLNNEGKSSGMNGFSSAGDWSGDKAANSMKKQLTEVQAAFEEEKSKTKSLTDRLNVLRSEFNQTKSAQVGAQKLLEEMQAVSQRNVAAAEARVKGELDKRQREIQQLQSQANIHATHAQGLQAALENLKQQQQQQQQQQIEPAVLDALRESNSKLGLDLANAEQQLIQVQAQLVEATEAKLRSIAELNQAREELAAQVAQAVAEVQQKKVSIDELESTCKDLNRQISEVKSAQKATEAENLRLTEQAARLSEENKHAAQAVVTAETAAAVAATSNTKTEKEAPASFDKTAYTKEQKAIAHKWDEFFKAENFNQSNLSLVDLYTNEPAINVELASDKDFKIEKVLAQGDVVISSLVGCYSSLKSKLVQIESELNTQRNKNNELREKNWKLVDALNTIEKSNEKLRKSPAKAATAAQSQNTTQEVESFKIAAQTELKSLLQSHFPHVKVADSSDFKSWAKNFFAKIDEEAQARESSSGNKSDTETLEKQANHYKAILSETEKTLFKLQTEVETMETGFEIKISEQKSTLAEQEKKISEFSKEKSTLAEKSAALEVKLAESNQKIKDLEEKHRQSSENSSASAETNNQELTELKSELAKEQKGRAELREQVAKLNLVVSTSQKALEQEKRIAEKLQLQLVQRTGEPISPRWKVTPLSDESCEESDSANFVGAAQSPLHSRTVGFGMQVGWKNKSDAKAEVTETVENGSAKTQQCENEKNAA